MERAFSDMAIDLWGCKGSSESGPVESKSVADACAGLTSLVVLRRCSGPSFDPLGTRLP